MKKFLTVTTMVFLTAALAVAPTSAKKGYGKVKGQVINVEQQVRTANGGEYDRLTIRTRNGEQLQLNLGYGGACDGCYQPGDQIRARVHSNDGAGGAQGVRSMQVRRDGKAFGYSNSNGTLVKNSGKRHAGAAGSTGGAGSGTADRVRDRIHEPGSAACPTCDSSRSAGAGRQTGGGSRGRGGN